MRFAVNPTRYAPSKNTAILANLANRALRAGLFRHCEERSDVAILV